MAQPEKCFLLFCFVRRAYISFRENADVPRDEKAGNGGERVGERHERAGVVRGDVDVVREEAAVHARDEHGAERHESDGDLPVASGKVHADEAQSRKYGSFSYKNTSYYAFCLLFDCFPRFTDSGRELADSCCRDPAFALCPVETVAPDDAEHPQRQIRNGREKSVLKKTNNVYLKKVMNFNRNTHFTDVEAQNVFHIAGQLDEKHVPAKVVASMRNEDCPEGT